jgi:hypothetical protein
MSSGHTAARRRHVAPPAGRTLSETEQVRHIGGGGARFDSRRGTFVHEPFQVSGMMMEHTNAT